jgi:alkylation response protein AidB-like acyl-CoA dehydrogenase
MNFELNEDQIAFQDTARKFAEHSLAPFAKQWDEHSEFPKQTFVEAGKLGLMAMYIPEEHHGIGLGRLDAALIMEQLARGCTSTAAFVSIHNMAFKMLSRYGQEEFISEWSEALASGEKLASYCLTEPGAGSDAASLTTRASHEEDHYLVNGSKAFISGAGSTDLLITMVRTGAPGAKGISCLAIPADLEGISYGKKEEKLGWNSQPTRQIQFDNVKVPVKNLLANEGDGFKLAMEGLDGGRINIAACSTGTAMAALEAATNYSKDRQQFNKTLSEFQITQMKLADMLTNLTAAKQMIRLAAFKLDSNDAEKTTYCAMAKRFATDIGFEICDEALQIFGGYGYIKEYPLERHLRDTRVHRILEGTNEIMRMIVARRLLNDQNLQLIND